MIKFEHSEVWGFRHAIRGMRNPLNSWDKSDSYETHIEDHETLETAPFEFFVGENDHDLMYRLIKGGQPHRKFLRQIMVSVDITAPLYWWKEFDTYKVGTTANSCSTMHKIHSRDLTLEDFSVEHITDDVALTIFKNNIYAMNKAREQFLKTKDKEHWYQMIQFLPTSYNQKRTVTMNYENLINILEYRRGHKLDEWREFCDWIESLPYGNLLKEGLE